MFCFRSDSKRTKPKRFAFVPIISFDIGTFVLSFWYRWHYYYVPHPNISEMVDSRLQMMGNIIHHPCHLHDHLLRQPQTTFLLTLTRSSSETQHWWGGVDVDLYTGICRDTLLRLLQKVDHHAPPWFFVFMGRRRSFTLHNRRWSRWDGRGWLLLALLLAFAILQLSRFFSEASPGLLCWAGLRASDGSENLCRWWRRRLWQHGFSSTTIDSEAGAEVKERKNKFLITLLHRYYIKVCQIEQVIYINPNWLWWGHMGISLKER